MLVFGLTLYKSSFPSKSYDLTSNHQTFRCSDISLKSKSNKDSVVFVYFSLCCSMQCQRVVRVLKLQVGTHHSHQSFACLWTQHTNSNHDCNFLRKRRRAPVSSVSSMRGIKYTWAPIRLNVRWVLLSTCCIRSYRWEVFPPLQS